MKTQSTNKIFLTAQEIERHFSVSYQKGLLFDSEKVLQQIKKRAKKKLLRKKYAAMNRWILSMYGEEIKQQREIDFLIKWINPLVGHGLFAKVQISPFSYIGEYTGLVRRRRFFGPRDNDYVFGYMIGPKDTPWVIDAKEAGNYTRFINHSDDPNVSSRWVITEDDIGHIIFFANRKISVGEQLTYDYGPYYWKSRPQPLEV